MRNFLGFTVIFSMLVMTVTANLLAIVGSAAVGFFAAPIALGAIGFT